MTNGKYQILILWNKTHDTQDKCCNYWLAALFIVIWWKLVRRRVVVWQKTNSVSVAYLLNQLIDMDCAIIGYRKKLAYESADGLVNELERMVKDVLASFRKAGEKR